MIRSSLRFYGPWGRNADAQHALEKFERLAPQLGSNSTWEHVLAYVGTERNDKVIAPFCRKRAPSTRTISLESKSIQSTTRYAATRAFRTCCAVSDWPNSRRFVSDLECFAMAGVKFPLKTKWPQLAGGFVVHS